MSDILIDIIVPLYKSKATIDRTLASIAMQTIKDRIKVTMIEDGVSETDRCYGAANRFGKILNLNYIINSENCGVGATRNYGIEHTSAPFIMFLDSDDTLASSFALISLYNEMVKTITNEEGESEYKYDIIAGSLLVEDAQKDENGKYQKSLHKEGENNTFIHGKLYRRSFIEEHSIRFPPLRRNEDGVFNLLCGLYSEKIGYIDILVHCYHFNTSSISKDTADSEVDFKMIKDYITSQIWFFEEKLQRGLADNNHSAAQTVDTLCMMFIYTNVVIKKFGNDKANEILPLINDYYELAYRPIEDIVSWDTIEKRYSIVLNTFKEYRAMPMNITLYGFIKAFQAD